MTSESTISCSRCGNTYNKSTFNTTFLGICPRCILTGEAETIPIPSTIGSLELLEPIGEGGMGIVYKGRHVRLGRTVAVKILSVEASSDPEFSMRFEREAKALALLNHPHIVTIYDFGQQEGLTYLAMEYIEGMSLDKRLAQGRLAKIDAVDIALSVCDALVEAHKAGIIHRDIKPANILIGSNNRVKVADFGIAAIIKKEGEKKLTLTGYTVATPMYAAPEQLAGTARQDVRIDIYSLGVVLYEMLTGELPVGSWVSVGEDLDPILKKALARNPDERYQTVEEFQADLKRFNMPESTVTVRRETHDEENIWIYTEAFLCTIAAAAFFWNVLNSITPKIFLKGEVIPTTTIVSEIRPDGSVVSLIRFEFWLTLLMLLTAAAMLGGYGLLTRYWGKKPPPTNINRNKILGTSWTVLKLGIIIVFLWIIRLAFNVDFMNNVMPLVGGLLLVVNLYIFCIGILQNQRLKRRIIHEFPLWLGFAISLIPPAVETLKYIMPLWEQKGLS